ncbi:hypothetical protein FRB90_006811 [Tulasnella sp. 427]|nr:hypothetical protein FRB90_006811 [Tulasnella sp. 427]
MVTTRGKKIEFKVELSDGEGEDAKLEVPREGAKQAKPPNKRRRTKNVKTDDDDTTFGLPFKPSSSARGNNRAIAEQTELITRRTGRGGKLRDLMNMPVDIFTEVCSYLDPYDLRRLAVTSKRLWDILMTKESQPIWKMALDAISELPQCPRDLNEPQYVCLLYSSECHTIGCRGRGTKVDWYHRVRFCAACYGVALVNNTTVTYSMFGVFDSDALESVKSYFDSDPVMHFEDDYSWRRSRKDNRRFLLRTLRQAAAEYAALSTEEERDEYEDRLEKEHDYRVKKGKAMRKWNSDQMAGKATDIAAGKQARSEIIKSKLLALGWDEKDLPMSNKEFKGIVFKNQKLTPKVWQNILPKLEPLLDACRTNRLAEEKIKRKSNREAAIREFARQTGLAAIDSASIEPTYLRTTLLPSIMNLPSVKSLIEEDTQTVTAEQWIDVAPEVRLFIIKWWRDCLHKVVAAVEGEDIKSTKVKKGTKVEEDNGHTEDDEDAILTAVEALRTPLAYATSVFACKAHYCTGIMPFSEAVQHALRWHSVHKIENQLDQTRPIGPEGKALVKKILGELGFDKPETVKWVEVLNSSEGSPKVYLCTRCDERTAKYMTFEELVFGTWRISLRTKIEHYLNAKRWYEKATDAIRTNPDKCYPSRTVTSILPTIIDNHNWLSNNAGVARRDDQATKERVLQLQAEFRKAGLRDPACDKEGIGGEDLQRHSWREILRNCELCPRSYGPSPTSTGRIELHIRAMHGKEPELEKDTTLQQYYPSDPCFL